MTPELTTPPTWDRQPHEPARWYARFAAYRDLGSTRTIEATYRRCTPAGTRPGSSWRDTARQWQWHERATAYDAHRDATDRKARESRQHDARELRYAILDELLHAVHAAITAADLRAMSTPQARAALPQLRSLLRDTLQLHRVEADATPGAGAVNAPAPTAADYLHMQQQHTAARIEAEEIHRHALAQLSAALAYLFDTPEKARILMQEAGFEHQRIDWSGSLDNAWHRAITEVEKLRQVHLIIHAAREHYWEDEQLNAAAAALGIPDTVRFAPIPSPYRLA